MHQNETREREGALNIKDTFASPFAVAVALAQTIRTRLVHFLEEGKKKNETFMPTQLSHICVCVCVCVCIPCTLRRKAPWFTILPAVLFLLSPLRGFVSWF